MNAPCRWCITAKPVHIQAIEPAAAAVTLVLKTGNQAHLKQLHDRALNRGFSLDADGLHRLSERRAGAV